MKLPDAVPKSLLTAEPTASDDTSDDTSDAPVRRVGMALVHQSGPQPASEIQLLLRKRLLILSIICALVTGIYTAVFFWSRVFPVLRQTGGVRGAVWVGLTLSTLVAATSAVLARILWSKRPLSLGQLRAMELIGFTMLAATEGWRIFASLRSGRILQHVSYDAVGMMLLASRQSLIWFALIVAYGTFIPNTWRRCTAVVSGLALIPLATTVIGNSFYGAIEGPLLFSYLFEVTTWMVLAGALAIYGSHRIEVLREQAFDARRLGQYQLRERIGTGGMGEVYRAEHALLRRPCAIKVIRPERAGDPRILRRFEREVQSTATLSHPNTVQIFDYGHAEDGTFYYVMEYLSGLTLEQLVQRHGPAPAHRSVHLLRQVCGALREAHLIGLIHRDIKPSNIIVCERGGLHDVAKLVDFGLVQDRGIWRDQETSTREVEIAGTPAFMSPEQTAGTKDVDARSDVYSLGAVAYFLLTGQPPFVRGTIMQTLAAHMYEPVAPMDGLRPDVPLDLQTVVLRCLEKDRAHRFQDIDGLQTALGMCNCAGHVDAV